MINIVATFNLGIPVTAAGTILFFMNSGGLASSLRE